MTAPVRARKSRGRKGSSRADHKAPGSNLSRLAPVLILVGLAAAVGSGLFLDSYTVSLQWPLRLHLQSPFVISARLQGDEAEKAQADQQGRRLTAYQEYACRKFGAACRVALAIQRAENASGACEVYHYNHDGTLDWGYFQINTVHLERPGLNLRDLLDCKANIDFAYQLYQERGFQPWSTYNSGAYLKCMRGGR